MSVVSISNLSYHDKHLILDIFGALDHNPVFCSICFDLPQNAAESAANQNSMDPYVKFQ